MTRGHQHACVIAGLLLCLALATGIVGSPGTVPNPGPVGDEAWRSSGLKDVETALAPLVPAARSYALTGDATERARLESLLRRFEGTSAAIERGPTDANRRGPGELLAAVRYMLPNIGAIARDLLALPDVRDARVTAPKVIALTALADKALTAIAELRAAPPTDPTPPSPKPRAKTVTVPEGVAVLLATVIWTISMGLLSIRRHGSWRRALTTLSRRRTVS